jgi:hypothetical protein
MIALSCVAGSNTGGSNLSSSVTPGKILTGKATYYPDRLNGHETASGDRFLRSENTAASNKLPLGTTAKVTNLKAGKSTDVNRDRSRARARQPQDRLNEGGSKAHGPEGRTRSGYNQGDWYTRQRRSKPGPLDCCSDFLHERESRMRNEIQAFGLRGTFPPSLRALDNR